MVFYNTSGTKVVGYTYDAWGNCTIDSSTTDYTLAHDNPIRYRGYYYDEDTGLYYLNARYYNPEWRRFISPDDTAYIDPETPNGLNLYCYCNNDPVDYADPSGHSVVAAILIGLGIGVAAGLGYAAYTDYQDNYYIDGSIGWQRYLGYSIIGGAIGAGIGLPIGYFGPALAASAGSAISSFFAFGAGNALALAGGGTSSVAGAYILSEALALVGIGILYSISLHGEPNSTIQSGGSYGEYDENGNLKYRVDTTGRPHFIKKYGKYFLPHVHKFEWYKYDGIWRFIEEVLPHL